MNGPANGTTAWRLARAEQDIQRLDVDKAERADVKRVEEAVNRLTWALVGFAFSVAASAVGVVVAMGGPG